MTATLSEATLNDLVTQHMRRDFTQLRADQTVAQALANLREFQPQGRIIYLYVTDAEGRLQGVVPTRRILLSALDTPVSAVMVRPVITIPHTATVLDACEFFTMHRLLAFPVIDDERRMIGLVDVDLYTEELTDLDRREGNDDLFQLIGVHVTTAQQANPLVSFRQRFPWLICNIVAGVLAALLAGFYEHELQKVVALALFIPVVLALAESVSIQSVSLTLQLLRGQRAAWAAMIPKAGRELAAGLLLGLACGTLVGLVALVWLRNGGVAACVFGGIAGGVSAAAVLGLLLPYVLHLLQRDPHVAAGPIALACADMVTLIIYFNLALAAGLTTSPRMEGTSMTNLARASIFVLLLVVSLPALADQQAPTRDQVIAAMRPYDGPSAKGIDSSTLTGKIMCGYQGWFTTPGDGADRGWRHYPSKGQFKPGSCNIDLWPDMSEMDEDEKYPTPFRHQDGRVATVFSSHHPKTVMRHFRWMEQYGIDGVFVQRFGSEINQPKDLRHCNVVLGHCREGANRSGRSYAVMYDLSGLPAGGTKRIIEDWKLLVDRMKIGNDPKDAAYLRHKGKPVVAVWGIGFNDGRKYTLAECEQLVDFLKNDRTYGGCTVFLGVPTGWRTLDKDCVKDPAMHKIIAKADIISPWTVGRYRTLQGVADHAKDRWKKDVDWCKDNGKDYLPVTFPGFSWHNMRPKSPFDEIPRQKGQFLWKQYAEAKKAGATMIYQAMFDEMDEGTAIFKCTNDPPVGESRFLTNEGLPTDHYLWLTGMGGKLLRGEVEATDKLPSRIDGGKKLPVMRLRAVQQIGGEMARWPTAK